MNRIIILIVIIISTVNFASADKVLVNIDFDLNNIAILEDSSKNKLSGIIPYKEIIDVDNYIDRQTALGRTIKINWHIINYEPNKALFSNYTGGYHLFDFTWFRLGNFADYKEKNGRWTSMQSFPTGFNLQPYSEATITEYGDIPVLISPTICPGGLCIGGGGEHYGEFNETIDKEIIRNNYKIRIIKYPVTKSVYLMLNDSDLINKKLELFGEITLGDSAIVTEMDSFYYPFDRYSVTIQPNSNIS